MLLRQGYFWPNMKEDARKLVNICKSWQEHENVQRLPSEFTTSADYLISFVVWGIDLIGALPTAPGGHKYCIIAVDYFSKWVEAEPLTTIRSEQIRKFFWKNIIYRFRCPKVIVTNNSTQFTNSNFQEFSEKLGITLHFIPIVHPQSNGQVEVTNRTIKIRNKETSGQE